MARRDEDETEFAKAMRGVTPFPQEKRQRLGPRRVVAKPPPKADPDTLAIKALHDLAAGIGPFSIEDTGEFVSGLGPGVDRRLLRRLRRGEYSVEAHLDLHGLRADEAKVEVDAFVWESVRRALRCVLIVHGRGRRSKDHIPVLKEKLVSWLSQRRLGKQVLAFATALPHDGGAGALYVLLRRA